MYIVVARVPGDAVTLQPAESDGTPIGEAETTAAGRLAEVVAEREAEHPRWVWDDTGRWYPPLLAAGVRIDRCVDLRLCHVILRNSTLTADSALASAARNAWDRAAPIGPDQPATPTYSALFELDSATAGHAAASKGATSGAAAVLSEFSAQQAAVTGCAEPGRLRLLLAAESAGALIAAEMQHAGLPWRADIHDRLLTELVGERTPPGTRPARLEELTNSIRTALDAPQLNPDSPADVLRALRRAGLMVTSTRSWEVKELEHPAIEPLLAYKKLSRLLTANGWAWMEAWVHGGRFRADYVPGGVVTGRWATRGGGALQLPRQIRGAVVADDGWKLVVADAAQLEPRMLAGLAGDTVMADAGRGKDLYNGIVDSGAVDTRAHAKVAMLGAMYGATTGESGRLMPRLTRAFPRAIGLVEDAARIGEHGDIVSTRLGRSSPRPSDAWRDTQQKAYDPQATAADERKARSQAKDWGRFTRNFIVQGSAAEWALCWMAELRKRLFVLVGDNNGAAADHADHGDAVHAPALTEGAHLVYFLHDEVIVHTPAHLAEQVVAEVTASADAAGRLLFGDFPVDFPVTAVVVDSYADAK